MTWLTRTTSIRKAALARFLEHPMDRLAHECRPVWMNSPALNELLHARVREIPYCLRLSAMGVDGGAVSDCISSADDEISPPRSRPSAPPYLTGPLPYKGFLLSQLYRDAASGAPWITAVQAVSDGGRLYGFLAADFRVNDIPFPELPTRRTQGWMQFKGDPAIRGTLFMQERVYSRMDERMDETLAMVETLYREHGVFDSFLYFSSARVVLWLMNTPHSYALHTLDEILSPDIGLAYRPQPYPDHAKVRRDDIGRVLARMRELRKADETIYLRSASLNIINGMVGLNFSCDGSHYMPADEFLRKDIRFWTGLANPRECEPHPGPLAYPPPNGAETDALLDASSPANVGNYEEILSRLMPFATLSGERFREIAAQCVWDRIPKGKYVFREGEHGNHAIYLIRGSVLLHANRTDPSDDAEADPSVAGQVVTADPGAPAIPRYALADREPRQQSAMALTDVEIVRVDNDLLDIMVTWDQLSGNPAQAGRAPDANPLDPRADGRLGLVKHALAFKNLPAANIDRLMASLSRVPAPAGQIVIRQGDPGDYYYLIESGRASVIREMPGYGSMELAELGPGDAFGEEALVTDAPRGASVHMKTDGVLLRLAKKDFTELLREPVLHRIGYDEALAKVKSGSAYWLDVRHEAEYAQRHFPGALSQPLHELRNHADSLDKQAEYICVCQSGRRGSAAAFLLSQRGFTALVLNGGMHAWPAAPRAA